MVALVALGFWRGTSHRDPLDLVPGRGQMRISPTVPLMGHQPMLAIALERLGAIGAAAAVRHDGVPRNRDS